MTDERRSRAYARRRDLREAPPRDPFGPGPTTQELELYRPDLSLERRGPDLSLEMSVEPWREPAPPPGGDRGERTRAFVERWSLWAAGLGRPPRDPSGRRPYPRREGMLVPGLFIAAGLGVAVMVGLLAGVLVSASGSDAAAAANTTAPTVTVTQRVTQPAVTETRTRTRTKTATVSVTQAPQPEQGGVLQPGAQGQAVAQLQQDLAALGLYGGQVNGQYDDATRAAVQNFQARAGVQGDPPGVAGQATLAAIAQAVGR